MRIRKGRFSGTLAQEVYVNSKYGQVVRSRPRRPWRPTVGRLDVQHNMGMVVSAWRNLTRKQYDAWTAAARKAKLNATSRGRSGDPHLYGLPPPARCY
jgi:hypothetical protein